MWFDEGARALIRVLAPKRRLVIYYMHIYEDEYILTLGGYSVQLILYILNGRLH